MNEQTTGTPIAALVTKIAAQSCESDQITNWLVNQMMSGCVVKGFVSAEILPPECLGEYIWTLVQKFRTPAQIEDWRNTEAHRAAVKAVETSNALKITQEVFENFGTRGNVASAIFTEVKPGMESKYQEWEGKMQVAQATFPGYRGAYVQPPAGDTQKWMTLIRFDTPETLSHWFNSPQRQNLLSESPELVSSVEFKAVTSSFPGWVPVDETGKGPANWKTALLVLLGLYPVVQLELMFLNPILRPLPGAVGNFIGNVGSVAATTWLTMPLCLMLPLFKSWLFPPKGATWHHDVKGLVLLSVLFAVEVAAFWVPMSH
jgi:antibiotic biosynthesis monooxygenase (ABM) superfamily enzyme